jgi:Flp pilus assembly pilin Flp
MEAGARWSRALQLLGQESGQTVAEYAIVLALIVGGIVTALGLTTPSIGSTIAGFVTNAVGKISF